VSAIRFILDFAIDRSYFWSELTLAQQMENRDVARAELARYEQLERIAERMAQGIGKERTYKEYLQETWDAAQDFAAWKAKA